jgi:hypothetical protein
MNENAARRKLDKKLDTLARDSESGTGNAKGFHKAVRNYGKALVDAALEDMAQDEAEAMEPCIMCDNMCVSMCCSKACYDEAEKLGIIQADPNK